MRICKGKYYKHGSYHEFKKGYFHQWGCNYEEFETGAGNISTAIVELPSGEIVMPAADEIQFLDHTKTEPSYDIEAICEEIDRTRADFGCKICVESNKDCCDGLIRVIKEVVRNGGKKPCGRM